jgi:hypothetical protein
VVSQDDISKSRGEELLDGAERYVEFFGDLTAGQALALQHLYLLRDS